jgi:hypothetical protein
MPPKKRSVKSKNIAKSRSTKPMTNTVEHILGLTLGPISKDGVQVRFAGKRRQRFTNRPADVIQIEGKYPLPTG